MREVQGCEVLFRGLSDRVSTHRLFVNAILIITYSDIFEHSHTCSWVPVIERVREHSRQGQCDGTSPANGGTAKPAAPPVPPNELGPTPRPSTSSTLADLD